MNKAIQKPGPYTMMLLVGASYKMNPLYRLGTNSNPNLGRFSDFFQIGMCIFNRKSQTPVEFADGEELFIAPYNQVKS